MTQHKTGARDEWLAARLQLLAAEVERVVAPPRRVRQALIDLARIIHASLALNNGG
jgi:predicted dithiol-disulfide oxidoreductase (DUF899 family)